jgi:hypothetical protein
LRVEPALVAILWTPAADSATTPSSGSASRLTSSLRLCPTVPPRVQACLQLAPPTDPLAPLSCPLLRLASRIEPSGLTFRSVVSLHRRLSIQFCCPAWALDLRLATGLPASPSTSTSACAAASISGTASWLSRPACAFRPDPSASPSALPVSLRRLLCLRICLPASRSACAFRSAFQPRLRLHRQLAPSMDPRALPSCLAAPLALRDRPFSFTFLPGCRFPGCLPPPALPAV